ncbi:MAG: hypothetical protein KDK78_10290, partial [Chlamydiia bacterium]|nr:hypothetical protein [Chlamydiia bacterium]
MTLDPINGLLPSVNGFGGIGVPPPNHPRSPLAAFRVTTPREVAALFPKSKEELSSLAEQAKTELLAVIDAVESLPVAHRSFKNSIQRMDDASAAFDVRHSSIGAIVLCHPDAEMRSHARQIKVELSQFGTEHLSGRRVFHIYRDYAEGRCATETLTAQQSYYLEEQLKSFKREGHYLDDAAFERLMDLKKELSEKSALFSKNVADDKSRVLVNREELKGLKDDFIDSLDRDGDQYVLTMDYPVVLPVLSDCEVAETRARMSLAFSNRAS